jgi:hypothetical protein
MAYSVDIIATQLFKTIKGFNHSIVLFTDDGQKTTDPNEARRFYATDIQMMVNFVVDETTNEIVVNLSKDTDIVELRPMLTSIRNLANRYIIEYTVKTFGKSISPKDFAYMAKNTIEEAINDEINELDCWDGYKKQGTKKGTGKNKDKHVNNCVPVSTDEAITFAPGHYPNVDHMSPGRAPKMKSPGQLGREHGIAGKRELTQREFMSLVGRTVATNNKKPWAEYAMVRDNFLTSPLEEGFSGWHGSARKSMNELGDARIIVKHRRSVDEEKRGARTRQIESIFIENGIGERFKFPSSNVTAAKAMLRHVQEGGVPHDSFGQHIYGIMEELTQLKTFQRKNKRNDFFEDAAIGEEIGGRIGSLRHSLKSMSGPKGYNAQFESFATENEEVSQERLDELKDNVTVSYFDESIAEALPYVARIIETLRGRQSNESAVVEFARQVMGSTSISLSEACDDDADLDSPTLQNHKDQLDEIGAWAKYLAPRMQNEELSVKMTQMAENIGTVGTGHAKMAMSAINVIRQHGRVAEATHLTTNKNDVEAAELTKISETFDKYTVRKIFGV